MAYTIQIIRGATTYNINDGNPFRLENADDLGGASVRNIEERGPYQDGATHLDHRLEPDTFTLRINVVGATAAALDGHRDTLNAIFKPVVGVPIILKITRDDGAVRQVDTRRTGRLAIPLVPINYPGHLHRAVVQLRAADPTWYNPTVQEQAFVPPSATWWLAFDTIGSANVMEHVEAPTQGQAWAHTGSVAAGSPWAIFFRSGSVTPVTPPDYAFHSQGGVSNIRFYANILDSGGYFYEAAGNLYAAGAFMSSGTANYLLATNGGTVYLYRDNVLLSTDTGDNSYAIAGSAAGSARWRSQFDNSVVSRWGAALPYAAIYNIELNATQRAALQQATSVGTAYSIAIVYAGDIDSYPIIAIRGPFANPILTNTTTGDTLNFTGGTVGSADVWTIDTRYGRKSVLDLAGSSVANYLSDDSDLVTFRLAPDPIASGGTNTIVIGGSAQSGSAGATLSWYNRYLGY